MGYEEGGGTAGGSLNRGNRLFLKSWPRNSKRSKLRRWEGRGSEEVGAASQASLGFALRRLFQTSLKLRSCYNTQWKAPKASVPSLPAPAKDDTLQMGKEEKKREASGFALGFYKTSGTKPSLSN